MRKKRVKGGILCGLAAVCILLAACGAEQKKPVGAPGGAEAAPEQSPEGSSQEPPEGSSQEPPESSSQESGENLDAGTEEIHTWEDGFKNMKYTEAYKKFTDTNPIMTQRFGADPYAMVYDGRVYFYMTADAFEYDGAGGIKENSYGKIQSINVVSTDDMMNFTDHGSIEAAGEKGAAKWAHNSWAPAAAWKEIDGKVKFFLYFADNGGGIGVLEADSPAGPFTDPLGEALISRQTPNCADVLWLFDPAVLVDDDGRAYLYFGGGVPEGKVSDPGTARVVELGEDMISIKGEPAAIDVPYLFEDSGIHKAGDKYYYTYCTNWQVDNAGTEKYGIHNAEIVSLESDSPMGPFVFKERILENPGTLCGLYGNNHHCVFSFQDRWYITYHSRVLEKAMGVEHGYRCTNIDEFSMGEDGTIGIIRQTFDGREQLKYVDPYAENSAVSMAMNAGLDTAPLSEGEPGSMVLTGIDNGDYMKVQGVDFGEEGPDSIECLMKKASGTDASSCGVRVSVDAPWGDVIAWISLEEGEGFTVSRADLEKEITGVHDLYFVFGGSGYEMKSWRFGAESEIHHPTAREIMDDIVVGWNLGNALDSNTKENEGLQSETSWGNPATTKEMIDLVKSTGVNLVRVPVTWFNHMDPENYEIDGEWMDRVEEVVNYVLDNDMYCIINVHHDTGMDGWLRASRTNLEENSRRFAAIWEQICERFGDYGEKLLFEGFNELLDDNNTWNTPGTEAVEVTNELNQLFVDTVRASGGNNATRCLIVNTYCAGGNRQSTNGFEMPADTIGSKLIVEAHIYQPYSFVSGTSETDDTWASGKSSLDAWLKNMDASFVQKGIPVLIGEFGCVDSRSDLERQTWLQYYMESCHNYGIKCVWWDNGAEWKVINRRKVEVAEPELFDIMVTEAKGGTYTVDVEKLSQESEAQSGNEVNLCAGEDNWSVYINSGNGAAGTVDYVENGIQLSVENKGKNTWDLQISYTGLTLEKDAVYKISFDYSGSPGQSMSFHIMQNYEDYQAYSSETLKYKEEAQHYEGEFKMTENTDSNARITFDCGAGKPDGTYAVTIENLTLIKAPQEP